MATKGESGKGGTRKVGDWKRARAVLPGMAAAYADAQKKAVNQEAQLFRRRVVECFKSSGKTNGISWRPNSPSTVNAKGSSKPLIDKGDLWGSVTIIKVSDDTFFCGVPNNARSKDGTKYVKIGAVHEFGKVITMKITRKQWRWFMANAKRLGPGNGSGGAKPKFRPGAVLTIKIPERSFMRSTRDAHFQTEKSRKRIQGRIAKFMRTATQGTLNQAKGGPT
jgi:phage gpG-like protein